MDVTAIVGITSCSKDYRPLPTNSVSDEHIFICGRCSTVYAAQYIGTTPITLAYIMSDVGEDATVTSGAYGRPTYNWNMFSYSYSAGTFFQPMVVRLCIIYGPPSQQ